MQQHIQLSERAGSNFNAFEMPGLPKEHTSSLTSSKQCMLHNIDLQVQRAEMKLDELVN